MSAALFALVPLLGLAVHRLVVRRTSSPVFVWPVDDRRHPMTRDERRWFRAQAAHAGAFGNPEAARIATLQVFDLDPKANAGLGRTGVSRG